MLDDLLGEAPLGLVAGLVGGLDLDDGVGHLPVPAVALGVHCCSTASGSSPSSGRWGLAWTREARNAGVAVRGRRP